MKKIKKSDSLVLKLADNSNTVFGRLLSWSLMMFITAVIGVIFTWPIWLALVIVL